MPSLVRLTLLLLSVTAVIAGSAYAARPAAQTATVTLNASVGPGFVITLTDANGAPVKSVPSGQYEIVVNDQSSFHNFHLAGPGIDRSTAVGDTVKVSWDVTLLPGTYTFQCDAHAADMKGSFQVTGAPVTSTVTTTTTTTTTTAVTPPGASPLKGAVGPGFTISLAAGGKRVTSLKAGRYALAVSDRSKIHSFVLEKSGGGFDKALTSVSFVGTKRTTVNLTKGKWKYYCAPHEASMHGSFTVS